MPNNILTKIKRAWNVFTTDEEEYISVGSGAGMRQDQGRIILGSGREMISSIYNRIGIDVAAIPLRHVRLNNDGRYADTIKSPLNNCLSIEANIDQTARSFILDTVISLCDEGAVAVVPVDTSTNPKKGSYDVFTMRVGEIVQWFPYHVQVNLYNEHTGLMELVTVPKTNTAIIENPLYTVMNAPNSTLKRLMEKLRILDVIDNQSGSGKLDLIIQLPYVIKTDTRRKQAEDRRDAIETQLKDSQYGIAYVDGTEKIIQLNRPAENNLMGQIEYLTSMLFSQLGLTPAVFDGTASESEMINYYNRTVEPILSAIADSMKRVFITPTGRSQGQSIMAFKDPFRLVTAETLAELADKFTRNEIISSNELRSVIGMKPSSDPGADELRNKNLNQGNEVVKPSSDEGNNKKEGE